MSAQVPEEPPCLLCPIFHAWAASLSFQAFVCFLFRCLLRKHSPSPALTLQSEVFTLSLSGTPSHTHTPSHSSSALQWNPHTPRNTHPLFLPNPLAPAPSSPSLAESRPLSFLALEKAFFFCYYAGQASPPCPWRTHYPPSVPYRMHMALPPASLQCTLSLSAPHRQPARAYLL